MSKSIIIVALLLVAGCEGETQAFTEPTTQCQADAEVIRDHSKCVSLMKNGADTVVVMQSDGSCRICSDLSVPGTAIPHN